MRKSYRLVPAAAAFFLAGSAHAADVPIYEVVSDDAVLGEIISSWDGFFVGVNGGYAKERYDGEFAGGLRPGFDGESVVGGFQAGYNYQFGYVVAGVEADATFGNLNGSTTVPGTAYDVQTGWMATVRGRLGLAANGFLTYATGGVAFTKIKTNYLGVAADTNATGWAAGFGVEYAVSNALAVRGEYLYANFGRQRFTYGATPASVKIDRHIIRAGLNYRFN